MRERPASGAASGGALGPTAGVTAADAGRVTRLIQRAEALRLRLYRDTKGKWTIGWGHNIQDKGIRLEVAELMLRLDMEETVADLDRALPWWRGLDVVRRAALFELCFNMGLPSLQSFRNTLPAMQRADWTAVARGLRASKWYRDVKAGRGERVIAMFVTGEWPAEVR